MQQFCINQYLSDGGLDRGDINFQRTAKTQNKEVGKGCQIYTRVRGSKISYQEGDSTLLFFLLSDSSSFFMHLKAMKAAATAAAAFPSL